MDLLYLDVELVLKEVKKVELMDQLLYLLVVSNFNNFINKI